ncbi:hypothetical protein [Mycobacterium sp.]|uniref:hypothetical protein n=1 Tax=Mycobacterium sp. TaxID=1785 RepID=UPI003F947352
MAPTACHADIAAGGWVLPKFEPLLTDSRTGVSVPGCYAAFTSDCQPPLSDEHWLSEVVLREASDNDRIRLLGLSWAPDREIALYPRSVANKVLCERHNHALWRLDATAGATFAALRRYQQDLNAAADRHGSEFFLASGEELERWLLKMLWGVTAAKMITSRGQPVSRLRRDVDLHMLADYLFRDGALPQGWGCHVIGRTDESVHAVAEIAVSLQPAEDGGVTFGTADMGIVTFGFAFGPLAAGPGHELRWHPSAVCLTDRSKTIQKVLALAWSEPPTPPCVWNFAGKVDLGSSGQRRPQSE